MSDLEYRIARLEKLVADLALLLSPTAFNSAKEDARERLVASMAVGE